MAHSFWKDLCGYEGVSVNEALPGPVAGYLISTEGGWAIEGDFPLTVYAIKDEAAEVLVDRFHRSNRHSHSSNSFAQMSAPYCPAKQVLSAHVIESRTRYLKAARELGRVPFAEFEREYRKADTARVAYELAKDALEAHIKEHGC